MNNNYLDDVYEDYFDCWDDFDWCYECGGYGDDYFVNDDGELECRCSTCPMNPSNNDEWDD